MSDNYGFDFNNDGKVSFTESYMTYHIERETAKNNSLYDALNSRHTSKRPADRKKESTDNDSESGTGIIYLILGASALGWILFFVEKALCIWQ